MKKHLGFTTIFLLLLLTSCSPKLANNEPEDTAWLIMRSIQEPYKYTEFDKYFDGGLTSEVKKQVYEKLKDYSKGINSFRSRTIVVIEPIMENNQAEYKQKRIEMIMVKTNEGYKVQTINLK
ncbi:MAG: hypothetical protein ACH0QD_10970 [Tepidibacillus sp.]